MANDDRSAKSLVQRILGGRKRGYVEDFPASEATSPPMTALFPHRRFSGLHDHDTQIRLWLPEKADIALREVAEASGKTVAGWLREYFVAFLYGEHELARMRTQASGLFYVPPESETRDLPMFSRSARPPYGEPLGKNMYPLKVYVARQLKADMQAQADKAGKRFSEFVRGLLIERLLGAHIWLEALPAWSDEDLRLGETWETEID